MTDIITADGIKSFLADNVKDIVKTEVIGKTTSTNDIVRTRALQGENEGLVLVAGEQTDGRGRLGRTFFSPGDTGLYMSLLLRPQIEPEHATLITTAAAVSVCEALEKVGAENPQIKWVNDIFVKGKKVCGILTESGFNGEKKRLDYAVLGVGINVYSPKGGFPKAIEEIAGAVFTEKREDFRNRIAAEFLNSFMAYYKNLSEGRHCSAYAEKCFVVGKQVSVIQGDSVRRASVLGVNDDCSLYVEFSDGERASLNSGEISVRV